jgi:hypothetical protein
MGTEWGVLPTCYFYGICNSFVGTALAARHGGFGLAFRTTKELCTYFGVASWTKPP